MSTLLLTISAFLLFGSCEINAQVPAEMRAETIARKYGSELPDAELGPYRGFSREQYFKHKCETEAGEFIYETVDDVEGVFQMRPRDPRDYFERLRKDDIPEDPWGHTNVDAQMPWSPFMRGYDYFETMTPPGPADSRWSKFYFSMPPEFGNGPIWRYSLGESDGNHYIYKKANEERSRPLIARTSKVRRSRYGYSWNEVRNKYDRHFGVWGGALVVKDLETNKSLAIKKGFFDSRYRICPRDKDVFFTYDFIRKVLKEKTPAESGEKGNE